MSLVGRLAPSPTGVLHLGNARTFLLAWLSVRHAGGRVLLRIEDIDGPRVRKEAAQQTIEDLQWLGLDWDGEVVVQSERQRHYDASLRELQRILSQRENAPSMDAATSGAPQADGEASDG